MSIIEIIHKYNNTVLPEICLIMNKRHGMRITTNDILAIQTYIKCDTKVSVKYQTKTMPEPDWIELEI